MSPEGHVELPKGFAWKECNPVRAKFPMHETWFFKAESAPGTHAFFLTREPIIGESYRESFGNVGLITGPPETYFKTGLSVNVLARVDQRMRIKPSRMAEKYIEEYMETQRLLIPLSQITRQKDGPLHTLRRQFRMSGIPVVLGVQLTEPITFYMEATGNDQTGTFYVIVFETPSAKWEQDAETAKVMIENRILDPRI